MTGPRVSRWGPRPRRLRGLAVAGALLASEAVASIHLDLDVSVNDAADGGVEPSVLALQAAVEAWNMCLRDLPTSIHVAVRAEFDDLPCSDARMVAARALTGSGQARGQWTFPSVLNAYLSGSDVDASEGLAVILNRELLAPASCRGAQWSATIPERDVTPGPLGSDAAPELFAAMQHELGHILGLDIGYDVLQVVRDQPAVYLTRTVSRIDQVALSELADERPDLAITTPRAVVWAGRYSRDLAWEILERGVPQLYWRDVSQGSEELLGDNARLLSNDAADFNLEGELVTVNDGCGPSHTLDGKLALVIDPVCGVSAAVTNVVRDGALAVFVATESPATRDEQPLESPVPVVLLEERRLADEWSQAPDKTVMFRVNGHRLRGADERGRVYLYTPERYDPARSLVHLDSLTVAGTTSSFPTSNTPVLGRGADHTCGFALSQLLDLGLAKPGCGDGNLAPDEACDDGPHNSDTQPNACRFSCELPTCGDGVVDDGEACDEGRLNALYPDACRPGCVPPRCGDGVLDVAHGERCDDGERNSDTRAGACSTHCRLPTCGDGVIDDGETCDDGNDNADDLADRCRRDCSLPRCGDGVTDWGLGETCDDGNTLADPWCDEECHGAMASAGSTADQLTPEWDASPTDAGNPGVTEHEADGGSPLVPAAVHDASEANEAALAAEDAGSRNAGCVCSTTRSPSRPSAFLGAGLALLSLTGAYRGLRWLNSANGRMAPSAGKRPCE